MEVKSTRHQIVTFRPGEIILFERAIGEALYIIQEGQIEVSKKGKDGAKIPIGIVGSGQYLGEMSVLTGHPHTATATALTDVTALKLSRDVIDSQLKAAPSWLVALTKGLISRLQHANEILRRNNVVDESLEEALHAIGSKAKNSTSGSSENVS